MLFIANIGIKAFTRNVGIFYDVLFYMINVSVKDGEWLLKESQLEKRKLSLFSYRKYLK